MAKFVEPKKIRGIFREFWDKSYEDIYLSMAGMADIWEGPGDYQNAYAGAATILGMQFYNDRLYIVMGGGTQTFIKVITPNGVEIHMLGAIACLMTHTAKDVYGSICVINENELIIGYLYVNLDMQFVTPYGLDLAQLWDNPSVKITVARVNSVSWVSAIKSTGGIQMFLHQKASPEDCLPCSVKNDAASNSKFSCIEENYSREANAIDSYRASRSMMATGANMSVTDMGGLHLFEKKPRPKVDAAECVLSIDEYINVFNRMKISPADIGNAGQKMSRSCSSVMYGNMIQTIQYRRDSTVLHDEYIESFVKGEEDNEKLYNKSVALVGLISPFLSELSTSKTDTETMRSLFSDQIWWGPIWFAGNKNEYVSDEKRINPYTLLQRIRFEDFIEVLSNAAAALPPMPDSQPLPMGWVIMADKDTTPVKYSKSSMTYFRFPFSICMSSAKLFQVNEMEFDAICDIETRPDGVLVWAWLDTSTLNNKMYTKLKCYKISNDGVFKLLDEYDIGYSMSPVDNSAKAVGISPDNDYWIVRDFFIKDSVSGGIDYVETKVNISSDMKKILDASNASPYANINEISGLSPGLAKGVVHYSDGMLEVHWDKYDLDDGFMGTPAWGNDGKSYSWTSGYSGYQIHNSDLL